LTNIKGSYLPFPIDKILIIAILNEHLKRGKIMEKKKETNIPKVKLAEMIDSRIKADGITVANLKIMAELKGIAKNYDWKTNKLGHLTAWEKS
jgi:hypothetical protein